MSALQQQAATAEILRVIAQFPHDVQPVFDVIAQSAARLCKAKKVAVYRYDSKLVHLVATYGMSEDQLVTANQMFPQTPNRATAGARAILTARVVEIPDSELDQDYDEEIFGGMQRSGILAVPMLRKGAPIGAIAVDRQKLGLFPRNLVYLLNTFADQAVIAIENARLFSEAQQRNRELSATSEVLKVISRSPTDVQPVFDAVAESAAKLCNAYDAVIFVKKADDLVVAAHHGQIPMDWTSRRISRQWFTGRAVFDRVPMHIHDLSAKGDEFPESRADALRQGHRTILAVPLLSEGEAIGAVVLRRLEVRPFTEKQIELLHTFADQSVIAIKNVQQFDEIGERNRELTEALDQQTATGAVLRVIAASPSDIQPVLDAVAENAARLCQAHDAVITLRVGDRASAQAHYGPMPRVHHEWPLDRGLVGARAIIDRCPVHVHDALEEANEFPLSYKVALDEGQRTLLAVPLLHHDEAIGALAVRRDYVEPFTEKQIDLLKTFADQAVIAIENARLFEQVQARTRELSEALQQQTATADVLKAISRSTFDLPAVLNALVASALRLCNSTEGGIILREADHLRLAAVVGSSAQLAQLLGRELKIDRSTISGRVMLSGHTEIISDIEADPEYERHVLRQFSQTRALMGVPLLRDGKVEGVFYICRREPGIFTERQSELVQTFADQAVIAIQNVRLFDEVQARTAELTESLQQQTATADVLKVISRSAFDLKLVLQTLVESASRLCDAEMGVITRQIGDKFYRAEAYGMSPESVEHIRAGPVEPDPSSAQGRVLLEGRVIHIPDIQADPDYAFEQAKRDGVRTVLGVPMMREGIAIGSMGLARATVRPFTDKQIELVSTFADQAAIAIENARLFHEVQQRNSELSESLEQQTATGSILRAIASSPTDIQPVLDAVVKSAAKLCGAYDTVILLSEGSSLVRKAHYGPIPISFTSWPIGRDWVAGRAFVDRKPIHVSDLLEAAEEYPAGQAMAMRQGHRTILSVPLKRKEEAIGVLTVRRTEVAPFTDKQIELVSTFADQAVIAIQNVRLFEEVQTRNRELRVALNQQTATSDLLKVIGRSTFDLQPVFDALAESAVRLCEAERACVFRYDGEFLRAVAWHNPSPELRDFLAANPIRLGRHTGAARAGLERKTIHIHDLREDSEYSFVAAEIDPVRTILAVPMLRGDELLGVTVIYRLEVRPFADSHIALMETFSDQTVIAIENARLFEQVQARTDELTESLQQQTATADVLKVISRSTFDLNTVLQTLVESAARLCDADRATIARQIGGAFFDVECYRITPEVMGLIRTIPITPDRGSVAGRALLEGRVIQIADVRADPEYTFSPEAQRLGGYRTLLGVPMLREGTPIGVLTLGRSDVRPFSEKQIELVSTFADQAVIAIENARLFEEVQARSRELTESLQQQTATADVLKVISRSAFDLDVVLTTLVQSAARLCNTGPGVFWRREGDVYRLAAAQIVSPEYELLQRQRETRPGRGSAVSRAVLERRAVQIVDAWSDPEYEEKDDARIGNVRSLLAVPLLRNGDPIGAFGFGRDRVEPFTDRQIELVRTFADQAVIAIENARLFEEVQARTRELTEALEYQTATSDVLSVISRSPSKAQPVLDTIVTTAGHLCQAEDAAIFMRGDDGNYHWRAGRSADPEHDRYLVENPISPGRGSATGRAALERRTIHIPDAKADPEYAWGEWLRLTGGRTFLAVPLLRDGDPIGVIVASRKRVEPFAGRQIELITTFADQAVIAIENARLFAEVQARTAELTESLQQQTATADVLKVISRSAFDLQPVFQTLVEAAARLCGADVGMISVRDGDVFRYAASFGYSEEFRTWEIAHPLSPGRGTMIGRAALEGRPIHVPDVCLDPEYEFPEVAEMGTWRAALSVPILREDHVLGVVALGRHNPGPYTDRQIEMVETFADQAAIAIQNARLFDEVQARTRDLSEALQQQTATADVLKVISRSAFDLKTVLQTLVESAVRLCDAEKGTITREIDGKFYRTESFGFSPEFREFIRTVPVEAERGSASGRALLEGKVVHITDVEKDPEYTFDEAKRLGGFGTIIGVPMMREGKAIGVLALTRSDVRPFSDRQIELVSTFADQAAIAIENVRLFESVEARTRELGRSLENLRSAQDRLIQTEKLASLGQLTAGIAHEIKNPLNFVNNFSTLSVELVDELQQLTDGAQTEHQRAEARELMATLKSNLDKVSQHGKRADSIVKNMLLHSRQGSSEHRPADINALVEESLNLAYHGARAEKQGFNITLEKSFDREAGKVDLFPQEITRVLLNLISNGFYATAKRRESADPGYEPVLSAATRNLGDHVEIRIRDNGTGIPAEIRTKLFTPFFTTKPAGEGTGLGLSLSHDIIAKQHAGSISVESEPGKYTEFVIVLPRNAASLAQSGGHA